MKITITMDIPATHRDEVMPMVKHVLGSSERLEYLISEYVSGWSRFDTRDITYKFEVEPKMSSLPKQKKEKN